MMKRIKIISICCIVFLGCFFCLKKDIYAQEAKENFEVEINNENIIDEIEKASEGVVTYFVLEEDIDINKPITIKNNQKICIDLAEYSLRAMNIDNAGYLEIKGTGKIITYSDVMVKNQEGGEFHLNGGTLSRDVSSSINGGVTMVAVKNYGDFYMRGSAKISLKANSRAQMARASVTGIEANSGSYTIENGYIECIANTTGTDSSVNVLALARGIDQKGGEGKVVDGYIKVQVTSTKIKSSTALNMDNGRLIVEGGTFNAPTTGVALDINNGTVILGKDDNVTDNNEPLLNGGAYNIAIGEDAKVYLYDGNMSDIKKIKGSFYENHYKILVIYVADSETIVTKTILWGETLPEIEKPVKKGNIFDGWYSGTNKYTIQDKLYKDTALAAKWIPILIKQIKFDKSEIICKEGEELELKLQYYPVDNGDDETVIWESSNTNVVEVNEGVLKARGAGEAIVKVSLANNMEVSAQCMVKVEHEHIFKSQIEPLCLSDGIKIYECRHCENQIVEVINKLGHNFEDVWSIDKKATASVNGSKSKHCIRCSAKTSVTPICKASGVKLSTASYTYNGKTKSPTVYIKDSKGNTISSSNYTLTKPSGRKNVGKYTYKVTFKNQYSGTKSLTMKINPKATSISSLTKASKAFTVKWKKQSDKMSTSRITGYQIRYSTYSSMSSAKTATVAGYTKTSKKITGLKAKKTYYVQVRTYKTVNGTKYYSAWSTKKSIKTK